MHLIVPEQLPRKIPFTKCLHLQHFRRGCFVEEIPVGRETYV
jgi:hypothetical protein